MMLKCIWPWKNLKCRSDSLNLSLMLQTSKSGWRKLAEHFNYLSKAGNLITTRAVLNPLDDVKYYFKKTIGLVWNRFFIKLKLSSTQRCYLIVICISNSDGLTSDTFMHRNADTFACTNKCVSSAKWINIGPSDLLPLSYHYVSYCEPFGFEKW